MALHTMPAPAHGSKLAAMLALGEGLLPVNNAKQTGAVIDNPLSSEVGQVWLTSQQETCTAGARSNSSKALDDMKQTSHGTFTPSYKRLAV
jgi:hypothetical protein